MDRVRDPQQLLLVIIVHFCALQVQKVLSHIFIKLPSGQLKTGQELDYFPFHKSKVIIELVGTIIRLITLSLEFLRLHFWEFMVFYISKRDSRFLLMGSH